jgi:DNA modification methylase
VTWRMLTGDCIEVMRGMDPESVHAVVTDSPYSLSFMGKDWDSFNGPLAFQKWSQRWAEEALRVLKPGGHVLTFGATRTYHRMVCGIEDAGFEIRDSLDWLYGQGWPKSRHALKPAHEPIVLARKKLKGTVGETLIAHGTGGLEVNGCRVGSEGRFNGPTSNVARVGMNHGNSSGACFRADYEGLKVSGRWPPNILLTHSPGCVCAGRRRVGRGEVQRNLPGQRIAVAARAMNARAPNESGSISNFGEETIEAWSCAPGCPVAELDRQSGLVGQLRGLRGDEPSSKTRNVYGRFSSRGPVKPHDEPGGASRFFPVFAWDLEFDVPFLYVAKASPGERNAGIGRNSHPTVKPIALMEWLCRLVTPPGGTILDPFLGSGTTGCAAVREGFDFVGIEQDPEHVKTAEQRIALAAGAPRAKRLSELKRGADVDAGQANLFGERRAD